MIKPYNTGKSSENLIGEGKQLIAPVGIMVDVYGVGRTDSINSVNPSLSAMLLKDSR